MKKTSFISGILILSMILITFQVTAKDFKGVITYKITYSGDNINEQMKAYLPKVMTTSFKGMMSRTDMIMGMGKTVKIKNGEDNSVITLIDMMGQKIAIKMSSEEVQQDLEKEKNVSVEIKNETKEILGYTCKKAVITMTDDAGGEDIIIVYFTNELGDNVNYWDTPEFRNIDGIMLEFEMPTPQFTMTFTATSIDKKNVPKSDFEIPDDYEIKTKEEVESIFGGM